MKVFLIRHGESENNLKGLWTGWFDSPLTEKGKQDALMAKDIIDRVKFDKVYSSDLIRAKTTLEITMPNTEYEALSTLREINVGSIASKPFNAVFDKEGNRLNKDGYTDFGGESFLDFRNRILCRSKITWHNAW